MTKALEIIDLKKVYTNGVEALKGISFSVDEGDFFALLGPNGAGKSTTIGVISSLVIKSSGKVSLFGVDIDKDISLAKSYIGIVPQEFNFLIFDKVIDIVVNQAGYYGLPRKLALERAEKYLKKLQLWDKRNERSITLSGGMKRRLMIARALVHEPKMLILDEPTAGVDIEIRRSMWAFLQELNQEGVTIILTTHYLEEAETLCRNVGIINHGQIIKIDKMRNIVTRLDKESFIFDLADPVADNIKVADYDIKVIDPCTIEVEVSKGQSLNTLFKAFEDNQHHILSMKNKSNRLEELFVRLTKKEAAENE